MAKYRQAKGFEFVGKIVTKEGLKVETPFDGLEKISFPVTDGKSTQYLQINAWHRGKDFEALAAEKVDDKYVKIEIKWAERFNKEVVESVAWFARHRVTLPKEKMLEKHVNFFKDKIEDFDKKEFITLEFVNSCDFLDMVKTYIDNGVLKETNIKTSGDIKFGKYINFEPKYMGVTSEEATLTGDISLVYTTGAVTDDVANKVLKIKGWVQDRTKEKGEEKATDKFFETELVYEYGAVEKGELIKELYKKKMEVLDGKYYASCFRTELFRGSADVEVPLTEFQKELIMLGIMTEEEARKDNNVKDDKVTLYKVQRPLTGAEYSEFRFLTDFTDSDFGIMSEAIDFGFGGNTDVINFGGDLPFSI